MSAIPASLERRAVSLGTANAVDYALQFLLPIVLTRTLDPHSIMNPGKVLESRRQSAP